MNSNDPASLQNLNDIVMPAAVNWWPLASGWYVLIGIMLISVLWFGYRTLQNWLANRYRRSALLELQQLAFGVQDDKSRDSSLKKLPILIKRTALSAYPRQQVANLSGIDWFNFLNSSTKKPLFTESLLAAMEYISYSNKELNAIDAQTINDLLAASSDWVKRHQPAPNGGSD
jgi:hypothetical protein